MNCTSTTEDVTTRSAFLARSVKPAVVIFLMMLSACASVRRDSDSFYGKSLPGQGKSSLPQEASLINKIDSHTSPRQAASLRLTDHGRKLIQSGHPTKALNHLEKALAVDSTNPYVYYYFAKAHFSLTNYRQSVEFLDVAESLLYSQPYWMAEVLSLRGENFQVMGLLKEASLSFAEALRLNPKNQKAAVGLNRVERALEVPSVR